MLETLALPDGVELERVTSTFTVETVPEGLKRAHRVAGGVWGRLRVAQGHVTFVLEESGESRRLGAGETQVIPPATPHHVEVEPDAEFAIEFHR